jgi:hypothetical protein
MLWEQLVTEGHARAARLRPLGPPLSILGLILMAIGCYVLFATAFQLPQYNNAANTLQQQAAQFQQQTSSVFSSAQVQNFSESDMAKIPPQSELPLVYKLLASSYQKIGQPPANLAVQTAKSASDFWSWNWPAGKIVYINRGDVQAFGAIVISSQTEPGSDPISQQIQQEGPHPVRWLAIFRKTPTGWDDVAIQYQEFVASPDEKTVTPDAIPVTLHKLMDMPGPSQ